jgi:hypothetical protein
MIYNMALPLTTTTSIRRANHTCGWRNTRCVQSRGLIINTTIHLCIVGRWPATMWDTSRKTEGERKKGQLTRRKPELLQQTSPITLACWLIWETSAEQEGTATEKSTTTTTQRMPALWSAGRLLRTPPLRRRTSRPRPSSATDVSPTTAGCGASDTGRSPRESWAHTNTNSPSRIPTTTTTK